jgi:putative MATE family efflux protein
MVERSLGPAVRGRDAVAGALDRAGVIAPERFDATVDLAWPRVVTGFAIMSKRTADVAMVGWAIGATAVAGLAFANAFWLVGKFVGVGLAGGTIGLVSQNYGGEARRRAATVVTTSAGFAALLALPVVAALTVFAEPLIGLLGPAPDARGFGVRYLVYAAPGLAFEYQNLIASRTYAGTGDTRTPMVVRAGGAVLNVVLSAGLIFGAGLGVVGAAVGTTLSTAAATAVFAWGMSGRSYGGRGASPVPLSFGAGVDPEIARQLVRVSAPLVARRLADGLIVFPLLAIAATFGSGIVAALEVGRRVRGLAGGFTWGFAIAASTLVGQHLGRGDEREASAYGWAIARLSAAVYLPLAAAIAFLADPIAGLFVGDPAVRGPAAAFVVAAAVGIVPLGLNGSMTGALRGAGDTRVPLVATLVGRYGCALPIAALGVVGPLGVAALHVAFVVETLVPAVVNTHRFRSNAWRAVSRVYRPPAAD